MQGLVPRDERELSVDLAADRISYLVLSYGVLAVAAYRSFVLDEAPWDLLALVIAAGTAGTAYRAVRGAASNRWVLVGLVSIAIAALVAAAIGLGLSS
jgi:hypothetical protein